MSIDSNYDVKIGQSAGVQSTTTNTAKSQSTQNTVFESTDAPKSKSQLTEKEVKYLVSKGYDISVMSDEEIQQALVPYYEEIQSSEADKTKNTTNSANTTSQNAEAPKEQASAGQTSSENQSKSVTINYNDKNLKSIEFMPDETGVYACDFYNLPPEEQEQFFVKNFAKKFYGEKWDSMSDEAKMQAMTSIEANFKENIPSWKFLQPEDKAKLALAFFAASDDVETMNLRFDGDMEKNYEAALDKPLNEQIESTANQIIKNRRSTESYQREQLDKDMAERFDSTSEDFYDKQLAYLEKKVQQDGIKSLNKAELIRYKMLSFASKAGVSLNDVFGGNVNSDKETSTFALMAKDEHFNEIYEKRKEMLYQESNDINKAHKEAMQYAVQDWFIHQFEGIDPKDQDALRAKYFELRDNCNNPEQKGMLAALAKHIQGLNSVNDDMDAILLQANAAASNDVKASIANSKDVVEAHDKGMVSEETIVGLQEANMESGPEEARAEVAITYNRVSKKAAAVATSKENLEKLSVKDQEKIFNDAIDNEDKYKDKEAANVIAENIGNAHESIELKLNEKYTKHAIESQDDELMVSIAKGTAKYSSKNQVQVSKNIMKASEKFNDEDAIKIQNTLADQIELSDKDNQLAMHKEVMSSKFSEVQEHAAANIKNYDPSVQSKAIDVVYESGNSKAVQKVIENLEKLPPDVQKTEVTRLIGEITLNSAVSTGELEAHLMGGTLTVKELSQLSPSQRRDYYIKLFENASPAKKIEILMSIAEVSGMIHKRTIYTVIARFAAPLLKGMIDSGMGKSMLEAGLPVDAVNKILTVMKSSTNNQVMGQLDALKKDSGFAKYFDNDEIKEVKRQSEGSEFMKNAFTPPIIDSPTRKKLKENESTMYINS